MRDQIINFLIDNSGDLYISSWINTVFYGCSFVAAIYKWKNLKHKQDSCGEQYFWLFLIFILFALGVNKQFDFQTTLIEAGRQIAQSGNWYEKRRSVQSFFAYGLFGLISIFLFIMLIRLSTREFWRHNALAAIGLVILCIYIVLRATSTSHVGFVADSKSQGEFRLTDIVEFFGILCIFVNTFARYKTGVEETSKIIKRKYKFSWGLSVLICIGMVAFFVFLLRSYIETLGTGLHSSSGTSGFTIGHWRPGIGDPSFMGWFTVYSYYFVAGVCFLKLFTRQARQRRQELTFWIFLCLSMAVLGGIKQFNLLVAVDALLRVIATSGGWIDQRRPVQVFVMAIVGVVFLFTVIRLLRKQVVKRHKITTIGFLYLFLFVLFRGISLHQFEDLIRGEILGARVNWIAELMGIYWICIAGLLSFASKAPSGKSLEVPAPKILSAQPKEVPVAKVLTKQPAEAAAPKVMSAQTAESTEAVALSNQPKEVPAPKILSARSAEAFVKSGIDYFNAGDVKKAISEFKKAIELDPTNAEAYINRADVYDKLGDYDKMFKDSDKAIELGPESPRAYANRGLAQAMLGKYEQSIEDFKIAARLGHEEAREALREKGIDW